MKNVVLDLDNTLICAEALTEFPFDKDGIRDKAIRFNIHDMDGYYIVFERPDLQEFLDWLFSNFNVSVFTAASQSYCIFIVEHILLAKPNREIQYIFFSDHCKISKKLYNGASKDLRLLWETFELDQFDPVDTIIIDDYDEVYETQPDNCIHIKEFRFMDDESEYDSVLLNDIKPRLEKFMKSSQL